MKIQKKRKGKLKSEKGISLSMGQICVTKGETARQKVVEKMRLEDMGSLPNMLN
jgi:uncharacterized protein YggU (UPF0235/DUF167 family)